MFSTQNYINTQTLGQKKNTTKFTTLSLKSDQESKCPAGLYIDGKCDWTHKSHYPVDGKNAYYTYFSFWAIIIALITFLAIAVPFMNTGRPLPTWLTYIFLSYIIAACVNSVSVFFGAQVLFFRQRFGEHVEQIDDDRVTISLKRYKMRSRAEVLVHSVPAILSIGMIVGLSFLTIGSSVNRWLLAALALLWIVIGASVYTIFPINNRKVGESVTVENQKKINGFEKLNFVYGQTNGIVLIVILLIACTVGVAVVSHKIIK